MRDACRLTAESPDPLLAAAALVALPPQPAGVDWPSEDWPSGPVPAGVRIVELIDAMFTDTSRYGTTYAVVVVHHGRVISERYGGVLEHFDRPAEPIGPCTRLLSWSMAKSMLHAAVGVLVGEGRLALDEPAPVPEWSGESDPRRAITLQQLLEMRDGLDFAEDYVDGEVSNVIEMLFGAGQRDMAAYASSRPLAVKPGTRFSYSSGTSNIISGIVARLVGKGSAYQAFLEERLFRAIGASSADPRFDEAGTWVASSYVHATARDYARFGLLYLRDGMWGSVRVIPAGWVDHGRRARSSDPEDGALYGAHWWAVGDTHGSFRAAGYEGQSILVCPALDLVVVRLGKTPAAQAPSLVAWRAAVVGEFATTLSSSRSEASAS
jgi:CubicO group peptidase (beta-lactamase class C family)